MIRATSAFPVWLPNKLPYLDQMPSSAMAQQQVQSTYAALPPCIYPSARPYTGFTTLLHRFSQYERSRAATLILLQHQQQQQQQQAATTMFVNSNIDPSSSASVAGAFATNTSSIYIELGELGKTTKSLNDQRVTLTDRQVIKLEVARMGAAVDRLNKARFATDTATTEFKQAIATSPAASATSPTSQPSPTSPDEIRITFDATDTLQRSLLRHAPSEREKIMFISGLVSKLDSRRRYENQAAVMKPRSRLDHIARAAEKS
ncbi:hypothetical protein SeMB42_g06585 [Synchytrium endobioticum]|uniref:Uncharacterized protein n=1 Tax=Synchytrium endobioticum TaxID=286115 RepID=A0A507CQ15_9FUNG|nr:hypothetical protein SeMB42_g06585 [Synchytrium endobioticum]TPX41180.1 hypothetical protein SeLEV6574_g06217 [Synchytrium endobioticum]